MLNKAMDWAVRQETETPMDKLVLLLLANYADVDGRAFPSIERLADLACSSIPAVRASLEALAEQGLITAVPGGPQQVWKLLES